MIELDEYSANDDDIAAAEEHAVVKNHRNRQCVPLRRHKLFLCIKILIVLLLTIQLGALIATYCWFSALPIDFNQIQRALSMLDRIDFTALARLSQIDFAALREIDFAEVQSLLEMLKKLYSL